MTRSLFAAQAADASGSAAHRVWAIVVSAALVVGAPVPPATAAAKVQTTSTSASGGRPSLSVSGDYVPLVGDFDGDGRSDIFWYAAGSAADSLWFGRADRQFTKVPETVVGSYRPVVLDINGDGRSDILWYAPGDAPDRVWLGKADRTFASHPFAAGGGDLEPYAGDFNGDGHTDILWYAPRGGADYEWFGRGDGTFTWRGVAIKGLYRIAVGDFEHNGRDEILLAGTWPGAHSIVAVALKSDGTFSDREFSGTVPGDVPFALDANGDGREDVFLYGPGSALDQMAYSIADPGPDVGPAFSLATTSIDGASYVPFAGDFDGDGHDDVFWYAPGSAPDSVWFDTAHEIPALRGHGPLLRWEVPLEGPYVTATVDDTTAYELVANGTLHAYRRSTGIPEWVQPVGCRSYDAQLHRQLEILKLDCGQSTSAAQTFVYDAVTGALRWHHPGASCPSDNSYYDARYLVPPGGGAARLTVVAARTGAIIWRSPVTAAGACALSGDRLMIGPPAVAAGASEYDFITHQLVFADANGALIRFGPGGSLAMCSNQSHVFGVSPAGSVAWSTQVSCAGYHSVRDFGSTTADLGTDIDIVTGQVLGVRPVPSGSINGVNGYRSGDGAVFISGYFQNSSGCGTGESVAFAGPYGVSPLLANARGVGLDFSHRAIAVFADDRHNPCLRPSFVAWDERGFIRWTLPRQWELGGAIGEVGSDIATNGGDEASAIVGLDGNDNFALVDLP